MEAVNRQVRTLGPIVNRLRSTGVYFTAPAIDASLPLLPGRVVQSVESKASVRRLSDMRPPVMVGEFSGGDGADCAMLVNLSLERSAHILFETRRQYATRECCEPSDGRFVPWSARGQWLAAGQGVLVLLSPK